MLHVGSRKEPSVLKLLITVVLALGVVIYAMISLGTGDWLWWQSRFSATPRAITVYCYGRTVDIKPGSYDFNAINAIIDESLSGRKRWDSLSMSSETYKDYQTRSNMVALEVFYHEPVRIHSSYRFFSNVDNLIIPLEGRHAQTNAVFGRNQGVMEAGSLHIESTAAFESYLNNQGICSVSASSSN